MDPREIFLSVKEKNLQGLFWKRVQLHPFGATVHTYLETGGYKHYIGNNLAGIKCTKGWLKRSISISNGKCVSAKTKEYIDGSAKYIDGHFRAYDDIGHFFLDYSRLIYSYYPVAKANYDCLWGYFAGLHGKWATDPQYFFKLVDVAFSIAPKVYDVPYIHIFIDDLKKGVEREVLDNEMVAYVEKRLP